MSSIVAIAVLGILVVGPQQTIGTGPGVRIASEHCAPLHGVGLARSHSGSHSASAGTGHLQQEATVSPVSKPAVLRIRDRMSHRDFARFPTTGIPIDARSRSLSTNLDLRCAVLRI
jgi:hypothetical protein